MEPLEVSLGEVTQFSSLCRCSSTVISILHGLILEGTCSVLCRFYLHRSNHHFSFIDVTQQCVYVFVKISVIYNINSVVYIANCHRYIHLVICEFT